MSKIAIASIAILIASGFVYLRVRGKEDTAESARAIVHAYCERTPSYVHDSDYVQRLIQDHHEAAFERNFQLGGRRSRAKFDANMYLFDVFTAMQRRAKQDGRPAVAKDLSEAHVQLQLDRVKRAAAR